MKKNYKKSEKGQALILIVFAIIGMIGITGLTIDGGFAYSDRRNAQNAADTAAYAAGRSMIREEDWENAGYTLADNNGYDNNGTTNTVEVVSPPISEYEAKPGYTYIEVLITSHYQTSFARVVGITQMTNRVSAITSVKLPTEVNMFDGNAIVSLNKTACKAFKFQGTSDTNITGGGVYVNSSCSTNAFFNNSHAGEMNAPSLCTVGGADYNVGVVNIPSGMSQEGCAQYTGDEYIMPLPDCGGGTATVDAATDTMSPGNYSGTFPPSGVTYLEAGIYCISGDFRMNSHDVLIGSDVVIYMIDGEVRWNGGAEVQLDAPNEGPFDGLLIYMPPDNDSPMTLNGNAAASSITGTILAPSSAIQINGTGDGGITGQIIGDTVDLSGTSTVNINYEAEENYHAETPPYLDLTE